MHTYLAYKCLENNVISQNKRCKESCVEQSQLNVQWTIN